MTRWNYTPMKSGRDDDYSRDERNQDDELKRVQAERAKQARARRSLSKRKTAQQDSDIQAYAVRTYLDAALADEINILKRTPEGRRNDQLNISAMKLAQLFNPTGTDQSLDRNTVRDELLRTARHIGLTSHESQATIKSAFGKGESDPRDLSQAVADSHQIMPQRRSSPRNGDIPDEADPFSRRVGIRCLSNVNAIVPQWVWEYDGSGRIQLNTLTLFAGRPAAGKSTAARYFASMLTRGELDGCWRDFPVSVAMVMNEEDLEAIVVPSMMAAGADMSRIIVPQFYLGDNETGMLAVADEHRLLDVLLDNDVRALFVDPVLSTIGGNVDTYRNNETREQLAPWVRIAKAINGIVIGITHLNKGSGVDVMRGMNGSSAFGEVARAVFGFASVSKDDPQHIMEQVKNSAGVTGLKLTYHLPLTGVDTADGPTLMTRFEITGESGIGIADIGSPEDNDVVTGIQQTMEWLHEYLSIEQPSSSRDVKSCASKTLGVNDRMVERAGRRLNVQIRHTNERGNHASFWVLPDYRG